jgi:hypothetical protein
MPCMTDDIADVYKYMDQLQDLSCFVYEPSQRSYTHRDRDWIKRRVYTRYREQAVTSDAS